MFKKIISVCLGILLAISVGAIVSSAETTEINEKTDFTFSDGKMTQEVLGNYLSRAVSLQGFCIESSTKDSLFEEDLRMIRRIGAKFIGRAAYYSWGGNMDTEQIENHFKIAKEQAAKAHAADPELILQACVFEIIFEGTVDSTPVPEWVLEEFGQPITQRNFDFDKMLPPKDSVYGRGYWSGKEDTAVPYIGNVETQMYIYYLITRYIDAGYEAVHLGQVELIMARNFDLITEWDKVLTKARAYAEENARRGVVLFDGHRELDSKGLKVGDRMVMDFYSCGGVTHETELKNGAEHAKMYHYEDKSISWIGRAPGGIHPLGFEMEIGFTLAEFDNFNGAGSSGQPHIATSNDVYCWGYDLITWYAIQPEWYRNQYLLECDEFFKETELDSEGNQTCFIQPACRRVICPEDADRPVVSLPLDDSMNIDSLLELFEKEKIEYEIDTETKLLTLTQLSNSLYRANYRSLECPTGSNQEDTIRQLFLGADAPEDPELLPSGYKASNSKDSGNSNEASAGVKSEQNPINTWLWIISGVLFAGAVLIMVCVLLIRKKKNN